MPKRARGGSPYPKKRYKKKTSPLVVLRNPSSKALHRSILGNKHFATLRYGTKLAIDPNGTIPFAQHVFSANSVYDPDYTAIGHQPRGFDQLMSLYDHFIVTKATIHVRADNKNSYGTQIIVSLRNTPGLPGTALEDILEYEPKKTINIASKWTGSVTMSVNPNTFLFGESKFNSDHDNKNSKLTGPVEQCYFHVAAMPYQLMDAAPIDMYVEIVYSGYAIEPSHPSIS